MPDSAESGKVNRQDYGRCSSWTNDQTGGEHPADDHWDEKSQHVHNRLGGEIFIGSFNSSPILLFLPKW